MRPDAKGELYNRFGDDGMVKVGIIGATGYAGAEIARLLLGHRDAEIKWLVSKSFVGQQY